MLNSSQNSNFWDCQLYNIGRDLNLSTVQIIEEGSGYSRGTTSGKAIELGLETPKKELHSGEGYRVHSTRLGQRGYGVAVAVKAFYGSRAEQLWDATIKFNELVPMHPNIMRMVAYSSAGSKVRFVVFDGDYPDSFARTMACALQIPDLVQCVTLGLKMVHGLSSGLSYLSDVGVPLPLIEIEDFEIYVNNEGNTIVGINPSDVESLKLQPVASNLDAEWDIFNRLCRKAFNECNRVLYRRLVSSACDDIIQTPVGERFDHLDTSIPQTLPYSIDFHEYQPFSAEYLDVVGDAPQREFIWAPLARGVASLKDVSNRFGNLPGIGLPASPNPPFRRLQAHSTLTPHRCLGYRREEILLTTNVFESAVLSYGTPGLQEMCPVCGESVCGREVFRCVCGGKDDVSQWNIKCSRCQTWQHGNCNVVPSLGIRHFVCRDCVSLGPLRTNDEDSCLIASPGIILQSSKEKYTPEDASLPSKINTKSFQGPKLEGFETVLRRHSRFRFGRIFTFLNSPIGEEHIWRTWSGKLDALTSMGQIEIGVMALSEAIEVIRKCEEDISLIERKQLADRIKELRDQRETLPTRIGILNWRLQRKITTKAATFAKDCLLVYRDALELSEATLIEKWTTA